MNECLQALHAKARSCRVTMEVGSTTSEVLMAAAKFIGRGCAEPNRAFLECKKADRNPEACLGAGEAVATCSLGV